MQANDPKGRLRRARGAAAEQEALAYLEARGLQLLDAGWHCRLGELDLVMLHGDILVFVEVRARQAGNLVSAVESIDSRKRQRFVRAARAWLGHHPEQAWRAARLDVVAIAGIELEWLQDAMQVNPG